MAKNDIAGLVGGAGLLTSIFTNLTAAVRERGGKGEDIHRLTRPEGREIISQMADLIVRRNGQEGTDSYPLSIDRSKPLDEMIAAGRYDWKNDDITKHFPVEKDGPTEVIAEVVHFGRYISSEDAIKEMDARGLRPATIEELLTFGAAFPDMQRKFPIVARGSVWRFLNGYCYVAYLDGDASKRNLGLHWLDGGWREDWRFLAVRK